MDKASQSAMDDLRVNGVIDLNQLPNEVEIVDLDDVPSPPHLNIDMCFWKEELEVLKQNIDYLFRE